jgi:hypothetical protein
VDIGLTLDPLLNKDPATVVVTIKDLGDLSTFGALKTVDGSSRAINADQLVLNRSLPIRDMFNILQLPHSESLLERS